MKINLLKKLQALPLQSTSREPLASLLALETQRHHDPRWSVSRRERKLSDRRSALLWLGLAVLVGFALLAMPYTMPRLGDLISTLVAANFGVLCAVAVFGTLSGLAVLKSWPDLPEKWADSLLCACLLAGVVAGGLLLIVASKVLTSNLF